MENINQITCKDFDQGSNYQKVDLKEKKKTSSHCFKWQTKLLGRATALKLCIFSLQSVQPRVDEEIECIEDNGNCHARKTIS